MGIIIDNLAVQADLSWESGALGIRFSDPAYIRSERVIIERASRDIGVVFEQGYHHIGQLPEHIELSVLRDALLTAESHDLRLKAPIRISS